jgi:uridine kinase
VDHELEEIKAMERTVLVGIGGCSGSGKTSLARELATQLEATLFPLDLYYRDLSQFPLDSRDKQNFDHPDSLESELFIEHIRELGEGRAIQRPVYDFAHHARVAGAFEAVEPARYVVVEGILALHYDERVRAQFEATARPMAEMYVLPSQTRATMTVSGTESLDWSIEQVLRGLRDRALLR